MFSLLKDYRARSIFRKIANYIDYEQYEIASESLNKKKWLRAYPSYYFYSSTLWSILKNQPEALSTINEGIQLFTQDGWLYAQKSYVLADLNDYEESLKYAKTALSYLPDNAEVLNNIGYCLCKRGNYNESIVYFDEAIRRDPYYAYPYNNKGLALLMLGDEQQALEEINYSLELDPGNSYAYKNRAKVHLALDKKELAKEDLERAINLGYTEDYDDEVDNILKALFK